MLKILGGRGSRVGTAALAGCVALSTFACSRTEPSAAPTAAVPAVEAASVAPMAPTVVAPTKAAVPPPDVAPFDVAEPAAAVQTPTPASRVDPPPTAVGPQAIPPPPAATVVRAATGLPAGAGRDTAQRLCTACHAVGMVTATGRTPEGWAEIIGQMMNLGLEASEEDLQTVHEYLSRELPPKGAS